MEMYRGWYQSSSSTLQAPPSLVSMPVLSNHTLAKVIAHCYHIHYLIPDNHNMYTYHVPMQTTFVETPIPFVVQV